MALDDAGNVYVTGILSGNVLRVSRSGQVQEVFDIAGTPLTSIRSLAVDSRDNLYVSAPSSNQVFEVAPDGDLTLLIDGSGDGSGNPLDGPTDIALDSQRNLYVAGINSWNVFKITPTGAIEEIIDETGDGAGNALSSPQYVTTDSAGNVYVSGTFSNNVFRVAPSGSITEIIDVNGDGRGNSLSRPQGIAVDDQGTVYVAGQSSKNVFSIAPDGTVTEILDLLSVPGPYALALPREVAVHRSSGTVFLSCWQPDTVFRIAPDGTFVELLDSSGDGAGNPFLASAGLAVDADGHAYAAGAASDNLFFATPNLAPVFDSRSPCDQVLTATAGVPLSIEIKATDTVFNELTLAASTLPPGAVSTPSVATGNPTSLTLDWTPSPSDVGTHSVVFACFDQASGFAMCPITIEVAECLLLLGAAPGAASVRAGGHTFATQLSGVTAALPVTMESPAELAVGELDRATRSLLAAPAAAPVVPIPLGGRDVWLLPGPGQLFFAQVVMWNPNGFPTNPEQWSRALATYVMPNGGLVTLPLGDKNGMDLGAALEQGTDGGYTLSFPFSIEGL